MRALTGKRILIIDTDKANFKNLMGLLESEGAEVLMSSDGENGFHRAQEIVPDLVLLESLLHGLDGFRVCKKLKEDEATRHIPIILFSSSREPVDVEKGFEMGCEEYITKPFNIDQVVSKIRALVLTHKYSIAEKTNASDIDVEVDQMKVLVVDDNPTNIDVIKKTLEPKNLNFFVAQNGMAALNLVSKVKPDLILLDIMMPEMNGYMVCQELKRNKATKDIPVIFVTAKIEIEDLEKGFSSGCVDYITKPFISSEMLARVSGHLRLRKLNQLKDEWIEQMEEAKSQLTKLVRERTVSLEKAKEEAEKANKEKTEYLIKLTHELRTPMNAILGFSQLLAMDPGPSLTPIQKKNIDHIKMAGNHLVALIDDILDLEKIETGKINLSCEKLRLEKLVNERVMPLVQGLAESLNIKIKNKIDTNSKVQIYCDPLRMSQALINLVSNAIKYNRKEGSVTLDFIKHPDGMARIIVADTGPGIPKEKLDSIFKPFIRLNSPDREIEGLGIGLTITKRFVELMGAKLLVQSKVGQGSVFSIQFPMTNK